MASCYAAAISSIRYQVLDIFGFNGRWLCGFLLFKIREIWGLPGNADPLARFPHRAFEDIADAEFPPAESLFEFRA
jgi:hypothetical protein